MPGSGTTRTWQPQTRPAGRRPSTATGQRTRAARTGTTSWHPASRWDDLNGSVKPDPGLVAAMAALVRTRLTDLTDLATVMAMALLNLAFIERGHELHAAVSGRGTRHPATPGHRPIARS